MWWAVSLLFTVGERITQVPESKPSVGDKAESFEVEAKVTK